MGIKKRKVLGSSFKFQVSSPRRILKLGILWLLVFVFSVSFIKTVKAQGIFFTQVDTLELEVTAEYFTTDPLQNIYILTASGVVQKYDVKGDLLFEYNNENFGKPTFIDATNPLRVLLFFSEYMTAIVLDRTLNELYTYKLVDYGFNQIGLLTTAPDNGLWLYDEWAYQLKKINSSGEIEVTSNDLSQVLNPDIAIIQIIIQNNKIYLFDVLGSVFVFDLYGQLIQEIGPLNATQIQVQEDVLVFFSKKRLITFNLRRRIEEQISLPLEKKLANGIRLEGKTLFYNLKDKILIFNK